MKQAQREAELWCAVVSRAFSDATASIRPRKSEKIDGQTKIGKKEAKKAMDTLNLVRQEARDWLLSDSQDFREVCFLASLDPDAVHDQARKLKANEWRSRSMEKFGDVIEKLEDTVDLEDNNATQPIHQAVAGTTHDTTA